jgi:hypothetical protein
MGRQLRGRWRELDEALLTQPVERVGVQPHGARDAFELDDVYVPVDRRQERMVDAIDARIRKT